MKRHYDAEANVAVAVGLLVLAATVGAVLGGLALGALALWRRA